MGWRVSLQAGFDAITVSTVENGWSRDRLPAPPHEGERIMETMIEEELTTSLPRPRYGRRPHAVRSCVTHSNTSRYGTARPVATVGSMTRARDTPF